MAETTRTGFYARLLPERDAPVESLGAFLNGLGTMLGVVAIFYWPLFLGLFGMGFAGTSLAMARSATTRRNFAIGFTIAVVGWMLGMINAVWNNLTLFP